MPDVTPGPISYEIQDLPVGSIVLWGSTTIPEGWLLCNGQSITQAAYPALYAVYPYTTLPDMRSRVPMGGTTGLFSTGGAETVTLTPAQMGIPAHQHLYYDRYPTSTNTVNSGSTDSSLYAFADHSKTSGGVTETNASEAHTNLQPFITLNFIVRAY
jgi:microcystin-dependent protein